MDIAVSAALSALSAEPDGGVTEQKALCGILKSQMGYHREKNSVTRFGSSKSHAPAKATVLRRSSS